MLDIKIKESKIQGQKQKIPRTTVAVNGLIEENPKYTTWYETDASGEKAKVHSITFSSQKIIDLLLNATFHEVESFLGGFSFSREIDFFPDIFLDISIRCAKKDYPAQEDARSTVIILKTTDKERWKKPYSIEEMMDATIAQLEQKTSLYATTKSRWSGSRFYKVEFSHQTYLSQTGSGLFEAIEVIEQAIKQADADLRLANDSQTLTTSFNFPLDIKSACLQYLIYFGQFLEDIGIEAETELKDEISRTLFTVFPKDKNESIERIRDALDLYLNAPGAKNFKVDPSIRNDVAVVQWVFQIQNLQNQMTLLLSAIQMKDATIQHLQLTIYELNEKVLELKKKTSEEEALIDGYLSVKKYDGKWFSINLPNILKRLKRKFQP